MAKTWIFTSAFCKSKMLEDGLKHIYKTPPKDVTHVVIDQHYPINKTENRAHIKRLCNEYGCVYVDSGKDLGLHHGVNNAMKVVGFGANDLLVGCDPDDRPQEGWVDAFRAIHGQPESKFAVVALNFSVIQHYLKTTPEKFKEETWAGHTVMVHHSVEMFNIVSIPGWFLTEIGGFWQPFNYYGCIESALFSQWSKRGLRLGYLKDFTAEASSVDRNDPEMLDPELRLYKDAHLGGFTRSFEDWLRLFHPHRL